MPTPTHHTLQYDKCFSQQVQQYEYELCMFRSAAQKEGGSSQNLGKWGRWNTDGAPYSMMLYENGNLVLVA